MATKAEKVLIIGLDCCEPSLAFDKYLSIMPNLKRLMDGGVWTTMNSTIPPITVPAWSCMMSSKDPGALGVYGFRNRKDHSYDGLFFAPSASINEPRMWHSLSKLGKRVIAIGVPQTYPVSAVNGYMVSCFLTPDPAKNQYTYPADFRNEIDRVLGKDGYMVDVPNYRTENKQEILDNIYKMTDRRFTLAKHLIANKPWDFFMLVEMGTDRIHHAFWKYCDPAHRKYEPGTKFENAIRDYYVHCDRWIGELVHAIPAGDRDRTAIFVVSDHGGKRIDGGIAVNEWLIREGYLSLPQYPKTPVPPAKLMAENKIDWARTRAWSEGGY